MTFRTSKSHFFRITILPLLYTAPHLPPPRLFGKKIGVVPLGGFLAAEAAVFFDCLPAVAGFAKGAQVVRVKEQIWITVVCDDVIDVGCDNWTVRRRAQFAQIAGFD